MYRKLGRQSSTCGSGDMLADRQIQTNTQTHKEACSKQYLARQPGAVYKEQILTSYLGDTLVLLAV